MSPESPSSQSQALSRPPLRQRIWQALRFGERGWVSSRVMMLGFGAGVVVSLGAGIWLSQASGEQDSTEATDPNAPAAQTEGVAKSVTAAPVRSAQIRQFLDATGTIEARELVPVKSQATGLQVIRVLVDEGQAVQANQPMAILDDSVLRTQLLQARASVMEAEAALAELQRGNRPEAIAQARESAKQAVARVVQTEADLELAEQRLKRNQSLHKDQAISDDRLSEVTAQARSAQAAKVQAEAALGEAQQRLQELERGPRQEDIAQAQAQLFRTQAQVREWEARIGQARVVASASGIVADRQVRVGELVSNDANLFTIIEGGLVELHLLVPETQIGRIQVGAPVRVTSDSNKQIQVVGKVREIDPVINATSRQATVKVALPPNPSLRTGMFLRGEVATAIGQGLAIPTAAVLPQGDGSAVVYRIKPDRTVNAVPIKTGEVLPGQWIEVKEGLQAGDAIVVKGAPYLKDGDRVQVTAQAPPPQRPQAPQQSPSPAASPTSS